MRDSFEVKYVCRSPTEGGTMQRKSLSVGETTTRISITEPGRQITDCCAIQCCGAAPISHYIQRLRFSGGRPIAPSVRRRGRNTPVAQGRLPVGIDSIMLCRNSSTGSALPKVLGCYRPQPVTNWTLSAQLFGEHISFFIF